MLLRIEIGLLRIDLFQFPRNARRQRPIEHSLLPQAI